MRIQQFLEHHGIVCNPFADEDAQTDLVFKSYCITHVHHPSWDKIYGEPSEPATAIVFGEKGSGKTAIGLQVVRHLNAYNAEHRGGQAFVILYDDFNPFLDRFRERFSGRKRGIESLLGQWMLWDHMDAILALGVTQLVDRLLDVKQARHPGAAADGPLEHGKLDAAQARDVLLLAACYDQSTGENVQQRWQAVRRKLRVPVWRSWLDVLLGLTVAGVVLGVVVGTGNWHYLKTFWPYLIIAAGWLPWLARRLKWTWTAHKVARNIRVVNQSPALLRRMLGGLGARRLAGQPLPAYQRKIGRAHV